MPDIFYELSRARKQERIDALIIKITIILFALIQIPIFFSLVVGEKPNIYFALAIELVAIVGAILVYFKKTSIAIFMATSFLYLIFAVVPHVFDSYHITIPVIIATFIFNTYVFEEKRFQCANITALIITLVSYYIALYAAYDIFFEFIVDSSIGIISFILLYLVIRYFKTDVENYEQKLQEVNSFLRQITDLNPHFIYAKDVDNKFIFINKTMANFLGHTPREIIGQNVDKFYESSETIERVVDIDLAQNKRNHFLVKAMSVNNETTYHELIQMPMLCENNQNRGTLGVSINITTRKKAETALQESEKRYKQLYENHQMGIVSAKEGKFSMVNDTFCAMTGYTRAEIIGKNIEDVMHPDDYKATLPKTAQVDRGEIKGATFEHRFIRKDGTIGHALVYHRLLIVEGKPTESTATLTDISQLKTIEQALRESENRYRQLYENHQMGIVTTLKGVFTTVNDTFCKMTGYDRNEIVGKYINEIMHPEDYANQAEEGRKVDSRIIPGLTTEHRFIRKDKSIGHAIVHIQLLQEGKRPVEAIATLTDISQLKTTEQALRKSETIYRKLIENAFDGIEIYESTPPQKEGGEWHHKLLVRNDRIYEMLGKTKKDIKQSSFLNQDILAMSPDFQTNGRKSEEYIWEVRDELQKNGVVNFEWQYGNEEQVLNTEMTIIKFYIEGKKYITNICKDITERKKAEIALQESESMYRYLFENAFDGIEVYTYEDENQKQGFVSRNQKFRELIGRNDNELYPLENGLRLMDISSKVQANGITSDKHRKNIKVELAKNKKAMFEWRFMHKDGHIVDTLASLHRFKLNKQVMLVSIYKDITERKKAEIAMRESETRYRYLFDNAFDGIEFYEYTPFESKKGKLIARNKKFRELLGRTDQELNVGEIPTLELSPELQPNGMTSGKYFEYIQSEFNKNREVHYEWRFNHKKGFPVDVDVSIHEYRGADDIAVLMGIFKDVTEKKKAEIALSESEALYRNLFENAFDGIEIYEYANEEGATARLVARNDRFRELLGKTDKEIDEVKAPSILQSSPKNQPNGQLSSEYFKERQQEFNKSRIAAFEWRFTHKKGHFVDVYLTLKEYEVNNKIVLIGIYKDITEQKKAEKTIQQNINQLHQKNQELQKFIKSNMQLENFAYLASHDLKEPIRTIVSFSQILKRSAYDKLSKDEQEYIDFIIKGSKNMSMLIRDLLTYSRVDTEDKNIQTIQVSDLLYTVNYELSALIKDSKAVIQLDDLPETIEADKIQMRQLFQNLITNAIRYASPERVPPLIKISAEERAHEWQFAINDNGVGIKSEFYERIFLLFRKLHGDREKGTGIGLALCKKIAENHGGKIWVESEYGTGSTFYFTISKNP